MKRDQKGQQGPDTKTGKKQNQGKGGNNSLNNIRKNNDVSSGDTPEEPHHSSSSGNAWHSPQRIRGSRS